MGFTPRQVRAMSFYDFQAAWIGWYKANAAEDDGALSADEEEQLASAIDRPLFWQ
jgi:hypothetical protein